MRVVNVNKKKTNGQARYACEDIMLETKKMIRKNL